MWKQISQSKLIKWTRKFLIHDITKTCLFKYTENFITKNENFQIKKKSFIFHISTQNIDFGYSLELPWRGGSNEYPQSVFMSRNKKNTPVNPSFTI